eukprot:305528-Rhodomonas_salina.4
MSGTGIADGALGQAMSGTETLAGEATQSSRPAQGHDTEHLARAKEDAELETCRVRMCHGESLHTTDAASRG